MVLLLLLLLLLELMVVVPRSTEVSSFPFSRKNLTLINRACYLSLLLVRCVRKESLTTDWPTHKGWDETQSRRSMRRTHLMWTDVLLASRPDLTYPQWTLKIFINKQFHVNHIDSICTTCTDNLIKLWIVYYYINGNTMQYSRWQFPIGYLWSIPSWPP